MRRSSRGLLVTLAAALAVAGCTSVDGNGRYGGDPIPGAPAPTTAAPATPTISPVTFNDCTSVIAPQIRDQPGGDRPLSFGCGKLRVPLDYRDPSRKAIELFLLRVRIDGQQKRIGSLVVNPGGPGGSGVDAAVGLGLSLPTDVLKRFDVVGFDPRGVGLSAPVECISGALKGRRRPRWTRTRRPTPRTRPRWRWPRRSRRLPGQVRRRPAALQHRGDRAGPRPGAAGRRGREADLPRLLVRDPARRRSTRSCSPGTCGRWCWTARSTRSRARSPRPRPRRPGSSGRSPVRGRLQGPQRRLPDRAGPARGRDPAAGQGPSGPDPRRQRRPEGDGRARLARRRLGAVHRGELGRAGAALADAANGNSSGIFALADRYNERDAKGHYTNLTDANISVNCADSAEKVPDATVRKSLAAWRTKYPLFGTTLALGMLTCQQWAAPREPLPAAGPPGPRRCW